MATRLFINLSNHPSSTWTEEQLKAAETYGEVVDMEFPDVDANATEEQVNRLAEEYLKMILGKGAPKDIMVHIMGEQSFCYALISLLQKNGVRCVASCTRRDVYLNEKGEAVHPFHFIQFREYVPRKMLALRCWWRMLKERCEVFFSKWSFLRRKGFYCWTALALIAFYELMLICYLQLEWPFLLALATFGVCLMCLMIFLGRLFGLDFSLRPTIVTKLLANAVAPTVSGSWYLLCFVIHIGWLTNAVLGLYTNHNVGFIEVLLSTLACILGIFFLILFFPNSNSEKNEDYEQVFISGISSINTNVSSWPNDYDKLNLIPLVRILQKLEDGHKARMVILLTDSFKNDASHFAVLNHIMKLVNPNPFVQGYLWGLRGITDKLKFLIREIAKKEFPEKSSQIQSMSIDFTAPCSYLVHYDVAFSILENTARAFDNQQHRLYFNLTPGTGIIGSLMTLMSIDGDRELFYYSQDKMPNEKTASKEEKEKFKQQLLMQVNKSDIPLKNLLSQALETIENSK